MSSSPSRSRLKRFAACWRSSALRGVARQSDACPRKRLRDPESVVPGFTFTGLTFTSWGHSIEEILSAVGRRRNSYVREDGNSDAPRVSCVRGFLTPLTRSRPFFDLNSRNSHAIIPCDWFHWCQRTKCNLRARAEFGLHLDSSEAQRGHRNRAKYLKTCGGQGRNRTADASLFRAAGSITYRHVSCGFKELGAVSLDAIWTATRRCQSLKDQNGFFNVLPLRAKLGEHVSEIHELY